MTFLLSIAAALRISKSGKKTAVQVRESTPSFEEIYEAHFAFAWRSLRGLGVQPAQIDDAAQDVFIVVHRRLSTYEPGSSLKSWLFGIVRRVASDYRRREKRKGGAVSIDEQIHSVDQVSPYQSAARMQALNLVEDFAATLDEEHRSIFILAEIEQLPVPEVALMLNLNANTIYSRLKVMKKKLIAQLSRRFDGKDGDWYE